MLACGEADGGSDAEAASPHEGAGGASGRAQKAGSPTALALDPLETQSLLSALWGPSNLIEDLIGLDSEAVVKELEGCK